MSTSSRSRMSMRANSPTIVMLLISPTRTPAIRTGERSASRDPSRNNAHAVKLWPTRVSGSLERTHSAAPRITASITTTEMARGSQRTPYYGLVTHAVIRERDHAAVVDHLEILDLERREI